MSPNGTDKRTQRIERLLEVSRTLGTSLELEALLESVVNASCELTESQKGAILLYESETDLLKYVAGQTQYRDSLKRIRVPLEKSLPGRVYTQKKSLVVHHVKPDSPAWREVERSLGIEVCSVLAVPMIFRDEPIGVIEAINKRDGSHYTEEDATILESLASHATVSILSTLMLEETKRAYAELEELERMKSDFIAISSHELRTPLGLILGHASDLMEQIKDKEAQHQLEVIIRSANRLKKIIEDLSNVNAVQTGDKRVPHRAVDIAKAVREMVSAFQPRVVEKKISLRTDLPKADLVVNGDEEKLSVVVSNLLENAINFTDRGGQILVSAEKLPGYVKTSVIDNGVGIPAKDMGKVFDKFYQVESHLTRHHGGMGLGLSVAKAMIELHNGQIWVESVEGKGSNFSFLLPSRADREKTLPVGMKTPALSKPFE